MKIFVKAKPGAKEERVIPPAAKLLPERGEEWYAVSVKEPPMQGRANEAICRVLAEHFKVSKSQVRLLSGASSKKKVFEIC